MFSKNKKYYHVLNRYDRTELPRISAHVVYVNSEKEAIKICEKYGIAYPMGAEVISRSITLLDPIKNHSIITKRKKGLGGKLFYEENNQLKTYV